MSELWLTPEEVGRNSNKYILVNYCVFSNEKMLEEIAEDIAIECSTGTWLPVMFESKELREEFAGKPYRIRRWNDSKTGEIDIAFPIINFDPEIGGIPLLLTAIAGTVFALKSVNSVKILDVTFPESYASKFCGPKLGIQGIKKILNISKRPPLSTSIKPNIGLDSEKYSEVVYQAALGGCDILLDDELLLNPINNIFEKRVSAVIKKINKVEQETGEIKIYGVNITARSDKVVSLAKKVIDLGATCLAINIVTSGYSSVRAICEEIDDNLVPIRGYKHLHAAFTRFPNHGIDMRVILKLSRMVGIDAIDTGALGRLSNDIEFVKEYNRVLVNKMCNYKKTYPVLSGGIHPGNVESNIKLFGLDTIIHAGGAIFGYPNGIQKGAEALRNAIEAAVDSIPIYEAMKKFSELENALKIPGWDYITIPEEYKHLSENIT